MMTPCDGSVGYQGNARRSLNSLYAALGTDRPSPAASGSRGGPLLGLGATKSAAAARPAAPSPAWSAAWPQHPAPLSDQAAGAGGKGAGGGAGARSCLEPQHLGLGGAGLPADPAWLPQFDLSGLVQQVLARGGQGLDAMMGYADGFIDGRCQSHPQEFAQR
ncbi:hypothetical protein HaLaN_00007 [Haematococcus lacustris]|uniref:Uncharacterized protein n=1 Tax=Haematococcus lacustris TaxID=44745 RepID=A0A699Y5L7_HAELA|nr:hypothetical protein HaLaN_00007 [Haematococcus lacustris]